MDERPEEVTDFRRNTPAEVIAASSDMSIDDHIATAEYAMEVVASQVLEGKDVVLLLDSITRLARAYNAGSEGSGRTMSGGLDSQAMQAPRQIFGAARGLRAVARKRRGLGNAVAAGALRLGSDLGIVVTLFYVLWGFHYARAPLGARLGWPEVAHPDAGELEKLAAEMVAAGNDAYLELHVVRDSGAATGMPDAVSAMEASIDAAWAEGGNAIGLREVGERSYGRAKRPYASRVLSLLHLGGFYMPFTG